MCHSDVAVEVRGRPADGATWRRLRMRPPSVTGGTQSITSDHSVTVTRVIGGVGVNSVSCFTLKAFFSRVCERFTS